MLWGEFYMALTAATFLPALKDDTRTAAIGLAGLVIWSALVNMFNVHGEVNREALTLFDLVFVTYC